MRVSDFKEGERVKINANLSRNYSSRHLYIGRSGTVEAPATNDPTYVRVRLDGNKTYDCYLPDELDKVVADQFWTVEELAEQIEGLQSLIEMYGQGFRLLKE